MPAPVIQFKRGQFANLPGLRAGEPGFTTDKYDLYVGINSTTDGNKFFGSHRYWNKEGATTGSGVRLVEGTDNGEDFVELKAPASVGAAVTYTFPAAAVAGGYLLVDADGNLSWDTTLDATTVNATGVGTVAFLQSTTVNASGIITATGGFVGDVTGNVTGDVTGNADTATALETARNFSISGDASSAQVSFDGTGNVGLAVTLATVNSDTGSFGSQTQIPVVTVNEKGLVTAVTTAAVGTALTVTGDSGSEQIDLLSEGLAITGGTNVTTTAASNGVSVALDPQINLTAVNASGIVTASSFSGSGAGLSAGTTPITTLDIDGASDIGADLADGDLLIVDDGAGGTNRKTAMSRVKSYVLGGGSGATFGAINVTGISTVAFVDATTLKVSAGSTFTGDIDANGGLDVAGAADFNGGLTADTATIEDLTAGRVLIAGTGGSVDDDAGLTYNAVDNALTVDGDIQSAGIITATTRLSTGAIGTGINIDTDTITGPSSITIDPSAINDNTGTVFILGDLQVKGTTTQIDSTVVSVADLAIEVAKGAANDAAANGAGFTVDSGDGDKTFHFEAVGDNFGSSENLNLATGKVYKINNTEILSASALSSAVSVDVASIDLDGATDIGADLVDADLILVDDGAGGTNRKATMSRVKDYVLGGGAGANFEQINVSGISTVTFADATTLKVGAGATVTGALDVDGGADISGGETTLSSATVSDLTATRLVIAGTSGALEDDANVTFSNDRLVLGGSGLSATEVSVSGIVTASDVRNSSGGLLPLVGVSTQSAHAGLVTAFKFRGSGLESFTLANGIADVELTGVAATTFTTSQTFTATSGQTSFTFSAGYSEGFLDVYQNGVRLITGTDYTATDGSGGVFTLAVGASLNDQIEAVAFKSLGDIVHVQSLKTVSDLTVSGIATISGSMNGAVNFTGVSTTGQLQTTDVNAAGIVTASSFSGSGSGLSAGTVPLTAIDIDGGSSLSGSLADADLFIVDDGAGGTNVNATALDIKNYVLGGGAGANFAAINVSGIATVTFADATTLKVGAGATVTGALDVDGGADISGGETTLSSATVSDLTQGRVVLAGASGALEDSANLTFGNNGLTVSSRGALVAAASTFSDDLAVGGDVVITGNLTVNGTTTQVNTNNTTIEDVLLELQVVDGGSLGSDTNKDVGLVLNYFDGSAKKAAMFWDDSAARFAMASEATETSGVLGSLTYAGLEIGGLFLNDCAGASQVISCSGTTRSLENITIDGGSF